MNREIRGFRRCAYIYVVDKGKVVVTILAAEKYFSADKVGSPQRF